MGINRVNTTAEEKNFRFLTNQSSILHTTDTNKITVNGVNVIVEKPKRGDVMCITHYTDEGGGVLLDADKQKVVWIDGLSINPKQLSKLYEPVGICLIVKGNKAIVRYREEKNIRWQAVDRWELQYSSIMTDGVEHSLTITLNGVENTNPFVFTSTSRAEFVEALNTWFLTYDTDYSAELVELNTDLPATDTTDIKDGGNYCNRIVVNARFNKQDWNTINISEIASIKRSDNKNIKAVNWYFLNNGFKTYFAGICCLAEAYDWYSLHGESPNNNMTSLNKNNPVSLDAFTNNTNCQILRDNFSSYNEYLESMIIKFPCGAGGSITEFPCGKENTYKLADCTYLDNNTSKQEILCPAANWAASINLNAPKLGAGNWWLPSVAEIVEIIRDITYGTSFWEAKPDIINRILAKLNSFDRRWSMFSPFISRFTSTMHVNGWWYLCAGYLGGYMDRRPYYSNAYVSPITIFEF